MSNNEITCIRSQVYHTFAFWTQVIFQSWLDGSFLGCGCGNVSETFVIGLGFPRFQLPEHVFCNRVPQRYVGNMVVDMCCKGRVRDPIDVCTTEIYAKTLGYPSVRQEFRQLC